MKVLALLDDRSGNNSQTLGVAKSLASNGSDIISLNIKYDNKASLHNYFKLFGFIGISKLQKLEITEIINKVKPQVIILAGRKLAPIGVWLKKYIIKQKKYHPMLVTIMNNSLLSNKLVDLEVVFSHDKKQNKNNQIVINNAPNHVNKHSLKTEGEKWHNVLKKFPSPTLGVLVGGSTKNTKFDISMADELLQCAKYIMSDKNSIMLSTSRRSAKTADFIEENFYKTFSQFNHYFYKWQESNNQNPYLAILNFSEEILVTGESISMISEALSTGKQVFVYAPQKLLKPKFLKFLGLLQPKKIENVKEVNNLYKLPIQKSNSADIIANKIKELSHEK